MVHCGAAVALASVLLQFGGNLRSAIVLLDGLTAMDLGVLTNNFGVAVNIVSGEMFMEEIIYIPP